MVGFANGQIAILGATGAQGGAVAHEALSRGWVVRAAGRDRGKLDVLNGAGMTAIQLLRIEPDQLARLFDGATSAFVTLAFAAGDRDHDVAEDVCKVSDAMSAAGVLRVVFTTSWLASERGAETSPTFDALRRLTDAALAGPVPSVVLKPAGYLDNFLTDDARRAVQGGSLPYLLPGGFTYRWVSHRTQALIALGLLERSRFAEGEYPIGRLANGDDLARAASKALRRPVAYASISPEAFADQWRDALGPAADAIARDYSDIVQHARDLGVEIEGDHVARAAGVTDPPLEAFFERHANRFVPNGS